MPAKIIDGKALASKKRLAMAELIKKENYKVELAVVLVGADEASAVYVRNKVKACEEVNVKSHSFKFDSDITQDELIEFIVSLNEKDNINGILVQLPLPKHINEQEVLSKISPLKDVDGFLADNIGNLMLGNKCSKACTPWGCIELIKSTNTDISGKNAVVIGRSNIVGKPVAVMLLEENATVTICHSKTKDLKSFTKQADILIAAIGRPNFVTKDMIKKDAIVIDVGINRVDGKLCGDVDFAGASEVASFITPVPGGVGPMTITMLLENTINAYKLQNGIS